jgi:bifunctional UDP-N-acetylglucosamine pyrophosphorylase/glucosamine-1-phosphate N-acetyltransferase
MKAVVLAAGKGSRLSPYTDIIPKPLMPVGLNDEGRFVTIIEQLFGQIRRAGIRDIQLIVNYKADLLMQYLKEDAGMDLRINYLVQSVLDGNGGAFYRAQGYLAGEPVLVTDCDNAIPDPDVFIKMRAFHESEGADITVGVSPVENVSKYAIIKTEGNRPVDIFEKPPSAEGWGNLAKSGVLILSAGMAALDREIARIPTGEYTTTQIIKYGIDQGKKVSLYPFEGGFLDVGTWPEYVSVLKKGLL